MKPAFSPGDRVRVRRVDAPGHIRTPYYARGKVGEVERFCGFFRNPEELAYGRYQCESRALYRVRFRQDEMWPDYRGPAHDTVDLDLYEHWLEPVAGRESE
ncbi:MAG TPA: SH3-like domain-containing protein [Burkholderiales bacterium]|nr:SH3-like domain-containing protein [Burkholderiales bacterium]